MTNDVMKTLNQISISLYEFSAMIGDKQVVAQGLTDVADEIGSLMVRMNRRDKISEERNVELNNEAVKRIKRLIRAVQ
jgi:hypothetical protein